MIKTQYALNKTTNQLIHVESDEIIKGTNYQVECLYCGEHLVAKAKESEKVTAHFAHQPKTKCPLKNMSDKEAIDAYGETLLHRTAKELFEREKEIYIPFTFIGSIEKTDLNNNIFPKEKIQYLGNKYKITSIELEKVEGNFKPDIKLGIKIFDKQGVEQSFKLFVEIAVTHFVDEEKKQKIISAKKNCIQINLKNFPRDEFENLSKITAEIKNPQRYELINFYFPNQEKITEHLNKKYAEKFETHNQKIINDREKLIKDGIINDSIVNIKETKHNEQVNCLCCGGIMINNGGYFFHYSKEKCSIFNSQEKTQVFLEYQEKKALKTFIKYLNYLNNNNKLWKLPEQKITFNIPFCYEDIDLFIKTLSVFDGGENFQIKRVKDFVCSDKDLVFIDLLDKNKNDYQIIVNFLYNSQANYLSHPEYDVLNVKCFNISEIYLKDYFSLFKELTSWKNFHFVFGQTTKNRLMLDFGHKNWSDLNTIKEREMLAEELRELQKIEAQRIKQEAEKNKQIKIDKLYNIFDAVIEDLYLKNKSINLQENSFRYELNEIKYFKNNFVGTIVNYEKILNKEKSYYRTAIKNSDSQETITLAIFISLEYFHDLFETIDGVQYKCPIRYFNIENKEINEKEILEAIQNIEICIPTNNQKEKLINAFNEEIIQIEKNREIAREVEKELKIKELASIQEKTARDNVERKIREQQQLEEERISQIVKLNQQKEKWEKEKQQEIDSFLNNILNKKLKFSKDAQEILVNKITEVKINSSKELVSFKPNKDTIIFVLNTKDTTKEYVLLDKIIEKKEIIKNKNIGCIFYRDIKDIDNKLLLVSKNQLILSKKDLYKKYDELRYNFLLIYQHEKEIEKGNIIKNELFQIIEYYQENKAFFENRFIKTDIAQVDKVIEKIFKTKKLKP